MIDVINNQENIRETADTEPKDFKELRELMLSAGGLKNLDELDKINIRTFKYDAELVSKVIESASDSDKRYFKDWEKLYVDMKIKSECEAESISLESDKRSVEANINMKKKVCEAYNLPGRYSWSIITPRLAFIRNWVLVVFFMLSALFNYVVFQGLADEEKRSMSVCLAIPFLIVSLVLIIINFAVVYPRMKDVNIVKSQIAEFEEELSQIELKRKMLKKESDELEEKIIRECVDLKEQDRSKNAII